MMERKACCAITRGQLSGALCSEGVSEKHQLKPQAQGNCCAHGLGGTSHPEMLAEKSLKSPLPLGPLHALSSSLAESRSQDLSPPLALPSRSRLLQAQRPDSFKYCILLLRTDCSTQADLEFVKHKYLGKGWYRLDHPCGPPHGICFLSLKLLCVSCSVTQAFTGADF